MKNIPHERKRVESGIRRLIIAYHKKTKATPGQIRIYLRKNKVVVTLQFIKHILADVRHST